MANRASDAQARAALESIERTRRQVIDEIDMPRWYWWGLALGWVGLGIVTDLRHPWITAARRWPSVRSMLRCRSGS